MTQIRIATSAELEAVAALWAGHGGPSKRPGGLDDVRRLHAWDPEAIAVASTDGEIRGAIIVGFDGWRCHVYRLAVEPAHRRSGIATALVDHAIDRARRLGATRIDAMIDKGNVGAIAFWEARGLVRDKSDGRWSLLLDPGDA
ncbi:MAG: GNAT family N-acetyltransferase [Ilumatobacteraceae bacterium]